MANNYNTKQQDGMRVKEKAFDYGISKQVIPEYISDNLKYEFFDWQKKALENFLTFQAIKEIENPNEPTHLMFNMATGTGKTLLMASMILYYYQQGYRNFLFFVNQNNIVDKTENNFIDNTHTKYLFKEKIVIDDKTITIKKVDAFSDYSQSIEIKFTSIQKLYNDIHLQRENQTTLDDLHRKNIVMLADEAHHLNTDTKGKVIQQELDNFEIRGNTSIYEIERKGWEHTVIKLILNKNGKKEENKNVLVEFTATIPATESIAKKYEYKIIHKFGLKEFLQAGYTKEINLISSTLNKKERVLQALLFQWYRHKIALKNDIANFKPVILFRSKTIEESKLDYEEFLNWIDNISSEDFNFLKDLASKIIESKSLYEQGKSRTEQVLFFIKNEVIKLGEIANWIKQSYQEKNTIITNSKTNKTKSERTDEETEKLLNSLEDKNNHIRAIFTVDRLTEGWDVLNLFDIVRLYQGQNAGGGNKTIPEATIKEKQLIGRGVRYYPFAHKEMIKNKRKFDNDLTNELRILEELFYYTYDEESRYISHLKTELKKDGYIQDDKVQKTFKIKSVFTNKYKKIWVNEQADNPKRKKNTLTNIRRENLCTKFEIKNLEYGESTIDFKDNNDNEYIRIKKKDFQTININIGDIEKHIFLKAINIKAKQDNSIYRFERLKEELQIETIDDFQNKFLKEFQIEIVLSKGDDFKSKKDIELFNEYVEQKVKLDFLLKFLNSLVTELNNISNPKIGTGFKIEKLEKFFNEPKTKSISLDKIKDEISNEKWYAIEGFAGTDEEIALIDFIKEKIGNLENKYDNIFLLKNEEVYKIYDFEKGRGFMPDFLLFLKSKNAENLYYQVFIESKGNLFLTNNDTYENSNQEWKEIFLLEITEKYSSGEILKAENDKYKLIGLPFFNKKQLDNFNKKYREYIDKE